MGRIIYLNGAPVGWNSKTMSGVTLSSTKAEYASMSEGLKKLKFIYMFLKYLKFIQSTRDDKIRYKRTKHMISVSYTHLTLPTNREV